MISKRMLRVGLVVAAVTLAVIGLASPASAHTATIRDKATLLCLDSNASGSATGSAYTLACNGGRYQQWTPTNVTGTVYTVVDLQTGRCLDSNGSGQAYTLPCNGGGYQRWYFTWYSDSYEIKDVATSRCLDSNAAGQLYTLPCNGGNFQRWYH
jgi:serine/threonine-protein kinase